VTLCTLPNRLHFLCSTYTCTYEYRAARTQKCAAKNSIYKQKSKGNLSYTCHAGSIGERRYSSYSLLTSALDRGEWSESLPSRTIPPGKGPPVPIVQEAGWAPQLVWTQRLEEKCFASARDRTPVIQSVV
jgi:hypothetical protein